MAVMSIFVWVVVSNIFLFIPVWGNDPIWRNIFEMGWNHHLVVYIRDEGYPGKVVGRKGKQVPVHPGKLTLHGYLANEPWMKIFEDVFPYWTMLLLMEEIPHQLRLVVYPIIYKVYISQVVQYFLHQQYCYVSLQELKTCKVSGRWDIPGLTVILAIKK